jgi:hypothetical protein
VEFILGKKGFKGSRGKGKIVNRESSDEQRTTIYEYRISSNERRSTNQKPKTRNQKQILKHEEREVFSDRINRMDRMLSAAGKSG